MSTFSAIVLSRLLSLVAAIPPSQQDLGFCSHIYSMHQYCTSQMSPTTIGIGQGPGIQPRVGKSGPRGPPGIVNYTAVDEKIMKKYSDLEERMEEKFRRLLAAANSKMEILASSTTEAERRIDQKVKSLQNYVDEEIGKTNITVAETDERVKSLMPSDCNETKVWGGNGGLVDIYIDGTRYQVYCDMQTDGGGWTVFQRRLDGSVDFYRTWEEYARGFGNKFGEFWLGLETIHQMTRGVNYELRVDLTDWDGSTAYAKYGTFRISGRSDSYRLTVQEYSGTAGDSLTPHSNGNRFSAKDKDLDIWNGDCAATRIAGWWFGRCANSNLNGKYNDTTTNDSGVYWKHWRGITRYSLKGSEMKFRKKRTE